jgi:hypothetical protein
MALLTRDQIIAAADAKSEVVNVPEWGGDVHVKVMTGTERDAWEASILDADDKVSKKQFRAKLLVQTLVDEQGKRLFTEADLDALSAKNANAITRLYEKASKLNALTKEDEDQLLGN